MMTVGDREGWIIRIYRECEGGIEKSVSRITDWHHKACGAMANGNREGRIFLSHAHTNNELFFLLSTKYCIYLLKEQPVCLMSGCKLNQCL